MATGHAKPYPCCNAHGGQRCEYVTWWQQFRSDAWKFLVCIVPRWLADWLIDQRRNSKADPNKW